MAVTLEWLSTCKAAIARVQRKSVQFITMAPLPSKFTNLDNSATYLFTALQSSGMGQAHNKILSNIRTMVDSPIDEHLGNAILC